jgi:hypothetical protein
LLPFNDDVGAAIGVSRCADCCHGCHCGGGVSLSLQCGGVAKRDAREHELA